MPLALPRRPTPHAPRAPLRPECRSHDALAALPTPLAPSRRPRARRDTLGHPSCRPRAPLMPPSCAPRAALMPPSRRLCRLPWHPCMPSRRPSRGLKTPRVPPALLTMPSLPSRRPREPPARPFMSSAPLAPRHARCALACPSHPALEALTPPSWPFAWPFAICFDPRAPRANQAPQAFKASLG
ncbi:hypothetical protein DENSPDRAFT_885183 [Dentipellis sp. KUC8613]|nr:hypothetical protein DENSPDRAFT_885183 [Dentipellis sp. KUC8613]